VEPASRALRDERELGRGVRLLGDKRLRCPRQGGQLSAQAVVQIARNTLALVLDEHVLQPTPQHVALGLCRYASLGRARLRPRQQLHQGAKERDDDRVRELAPNREAESQWNEAERVARTIEARVVRVRSAVG
jgi:hypothetical protein